LLWNERQKRGGRVAERGLQDHGRRGRCSLFRPDRCPDVDSAYADEGRWRLGKVSKNRLAKIALEGTDVVSIGSLLKGPTVIATSNDPVAAPKVAIEFAKTNEKFVILGGAMGTTVLNPDAVKALASLPSLDELRAKILGLLVAPATKIAQLSTAPAAKLARVVQAYASKGEAA
jgi:large subunit ribosomal protein L10